MGVFNTKGFVTLSDIDALVARVASLEAAVLFESDLVAYRADTNYQAAATMLNLKNAGFAARRIPTTLGKATIIEGINFGQDFIEPPIVVCNAVSDKDPYIAFPENVTSKTCSIRVIPINTMQNKKKDTKINAKGSGDYIDIIAIGKTKA
jgi:hypothetical protein